MTTDLRIALRTLRRTPVATLAIVLVAALGTGAATTIFALLDAGLLRPLPYAQADRLVALFRVERQGTEPRNPAPPADVADWSTADVFESVVAARVWSPTLTGSGEPARISAILATPGLFGLLGVAPWLGSTTGDARGVVLGHGLWTRQFGADPAVIGQTIVLDGEPRTVLAIMPRGFRFPPFWAADAELWAPLELTPAQQADRSAAYLRVFGRLRDGVTVDGAQAALTALAGRLAQTYPETNEDVGIRVEPLHEPAVADSRRILVVMAVAVGLLLLITCANVANVLLARALGRRKDAAVRAALGAGRRDLVALGLTEGLLLTSAGGVLGVLMALWALRVITAFGPAGLLPGAAPTLDLRVAAFATLLALVTGLAVGLLPGLRLARAAPAEVLRTRTAAREEAGLSQGLVVAEVAVASALVAVAMSTATALRALITRDPGFDAAVVATVVGMPGPGYSDAAAQLRLIESVGEGLRTIPGVLAVGAVNHVPVAGDLWRTTVEPEGTVGADLSASWRVIEGDYFGALGIPFVRGRAFDRPAADGPRVAIVNEAFARRAFGSQDPLGRRIRFGEGEGAGPWMEVVGVVADAAQTGVETPILPEVLLPYAQNTTPWFRETGFVVRLGPGAVPAIGEAIADAVHAVDGKLPVEASRRMSEVLRGQLSDRSFATFTLGAFGATALMLAGVGLHAMMLQLVRRRGHEFAVRLALGASRSDLTRLVVGHGLRLAGLGLLLGLPVAALAVTGAMRFLPGPSHWPVTLVAIVGALGSAVVAAAALPARTAARTAPFAALRDG